MRSYSPDSRRNPVWYCCAFQNMSAAVAPAPGRQIAIDRRGVLIPSQLQGVDESGVCKSDAHSELIPLELGDAESRQAILKALSQAWTSM